MRKSFVGYVKEDDLRNHIGWDKGLFSDSRSPKQETLDIPTLWKTCDDVYVYEKRSKRVRVTIEILQD